MKIVELNEDSPLVSSGVIYDAFLARLIETSIVAARQDYVSPDDTHKLAGSMAGLGACRSAEIEWVANVVSAAMMVSGSHPIIPPTIRGAFRANAILRELLRGPIG